MKKFWIILSLAALISITAYGTNAILSNNEQLPPAPVGNAQAAEFSEVRAAHILVDKEADAIRIRKEIVDGKDFYQAAREYSSCPSSRNGGDLGWFGKGQMVPEFEKAAFSTPEGEISQPVKTQFGWHLIKVIGRR